MSSAARVPLYWKVCLINGVVFFAGTVALAVSPATVSSPPVPSEAVVLAAGLAVILLMNALLLRTSLAPLDRLIRFMDRVDLLSPGERLPEQGGGSVATLVQTFNAMLSRLETERRTSTGRALAAQEAERQRVAQELHDEIGQSLTVVLLGLQRVADQAPGELADEVGLIQESARSSLDDVRRVARRLRPGVLEDLGLLSALGALATDLSTHGDVHVRRELEPGLSRLPAQTELVIYRVAQEALTNAARHSGAATVDFSLGRQGDGVLLRIADDGRGLDHASEGSGIRGMRERALLVGGQLTIAARPGGGTEVRLRVPVEAP